MRTRPLILWGVDPVAASLAEGFLASFSPSTDAALLRLFAPQQDSLPEFKLLLYKLGEEAKSHTMSPEPNVVLLAAAFRPEAEKTLPLLQQISRTLEVALSGSQTITLVVLVPPAIASDEEKVRTFKFFLRLEELIGEVRFLRIVFVNQVALDLYQDPTSLGASAKEIHELLSRELLDEDLDDVSQGIGYAAIGNRLKVAGRKCGYSTVGSYRLVYLADAGMEHLKARFQRELFNHGFLNVPAVADKERVSIQTRADRFILDYVNRVQSQLPVTTLLAGSVLSQPSDPGEIDGKIRAFDDEVDRALNQQAPQIKQIQESLDGCAHQELLDFLLHSPGYLAGAKLYVDALHGTRLVTQPAEDSGQPSGVALFVQDFCLGPFLHSLEEVFEPSLAGAAAEVGASLPARKEKQSRFDWLISAIKTIGAEQQKIESGAASPARFLVAAWGCLLTHLAQTPSDATQARELVRDLSVALAKESGASFDLVQQHQEKRAPSEAALRGLPAQYGWFGRNLTKRQEFKDKKQELENTLRQLDLARDGLQRAFDVMHTLFMTLINTAVVPYIVRTQITHTFAEEVHKTAASFASFLVSLEDSVEEDWARFSSIPAYSTSIAATVLTPSKLNVLYQTTLDKSGKKSMAEFAKSVLAFFPARAANAVGKKLSYQECHNVKDHYLAGSPSLLDRMADYAEELFNPIRRLDILDIIELGGKDEALHLMTDKVEKSKKFLAFASGMIPSVENHGGMNTIFVVRTAGGEESRLTSPEYAHLFQPHSRFIDSQDPNVIDLTCLIFGFPAFLMHALHEGHKLAQASTKSPAADLWPA